MMNVSGSNRQADVASRQLTGFKGVEATTGHTSPRVTAQPLEPTLQSALRAIVLILGVLLLIASVVMFGQPGYSPTDAAPASLLALAGAVVFGVGLFMPERGLLRRTDTADLPGALAEELPLASALDDADSDRG